MLIQQIVSLMIRIKAVRHRNDDFEFLCKDAEWLHLKLIEITS